MGNHFRNLLAMAVLAIAATVPGHCATPDAKLVQAFTTVTSGTAYSLPAVGVYYHVMQWAIAGAPASCTVKVQQSIDNTNWSDLIAAQTCTANGQSGFVVGSTMYVRFNVTALTAGATLQVIYAGYTQNPAPAASGALATQIQGAAATGSLANMNPVLIAMANAGSMYMVGGTIAFADASGNSPSALSVGNFNSIFNGATWDRQRSASAANMGTQPSIGAQLVENGGRWSVNSAPAVSSQATASKAAGGAGVRHVIDKVCFSAGAVVAPALTQLTVNIRDGATGAGTVLQSFTIVIPAATGQSAAPFCTPTLNLIGTAATAATAEWSALLTNLSESVTITGYDVQ